MTEGKAAPTFHRHCEPEAKQSRGRPLRPAVRRPLGCFVAALLAKTGEGRRSSQRRERGAALLAKAEAKGSAPRRDGESRNGRTPLSSPPDPPPNAPASGSASSGRNS